MICSRAVLMMLVGFAIACGGGSEAGSASEESESGATRVTSAADLPDPCGLVTEEEISELLWRDMNSAQREAMQARNAQYVFTKRVETVNLPAGRTCFFQHRQIARDTVWSEGDFQLRTLGRQTFDIFAGSSSSKDPIPGVGDQAFYMSNAAYGRRGEVGVEVVEFGSKDVEIELLKHAVAKLP